jgi:hypothetical protein
MKVASVLITLKIIIGFVLLVSVVFSWFGPRDEPLTPILVDENAERCRILARALDVVVYQRHRPDLAQAKDVLSTCVRPDLEGCPYMVEVGFELVQADRQDLAAQVSKAFDVLDCADELRFAMKHGLEAYRDARVLIAKANE